jgi:hypothetical protein
MARTKATVAQRTARSLWQRSAWGPVLNHSVDHCLPVLIDKIYEANQTLVGEVSWLALVEYCTDRDPANYLVTPIDSPAYLDLPAADCEAQGVKPMLAWIQKAYDDQSLGSVLPADLFKPGACSLADMCCIARAFTIFGTHEDFQAIRSFLLHKIRETHLSVHELSDALRILPVGSYWAGELLGHIYQRYKRIGHSNCPEVGRCVCGGNWRKGEHEHHECLQAWVWSNVELLKEMNRRRCKETTALHLEVSAGAQARVAQACASFGQYCEEATRQRIDTWVLQLDDKSPLPVGTFPHSGPGGRKTLVKTMTRLGEISGNLRLEWLEENGGCYLETHPRMPMYGMLPYGTKPGTKITKSTEMSRLWLASRGYGSDGCESSIEVPGVARVDSGVDCSMPGGWPLKHR